MPTALPPLHSLFRQLHRYGRLVIFRSPPGSVTVMGQQFLTLNGPIRKGTLTWERDTLLDCDGGESGQSATFRRYLLGVSPSDTSDCEECRILGCYAVWIL
jgi:hypothetical protein